ncbi:MAG: hypothetical protein EAS52_15705 [Parapedobacter sp.]|nr:MAG: hypothetical protein EAS52_15705 [Parapedobacter sp.]
MYDFLCLPIYTVGAWRLPLVEAFFFNLVRCLSDAISGYGETRLVNRCADGVRCSSAEHQANRRTEITVLAY